MHHPHGSLAMTHGIKACYKLLANRHRRDTGLKKKRHPGSDTDIECETMKPAIYARAWNTVPETRPPQSPVEKRVRAFLDGKTHGEDLLHALYDHVLEEPIPERLLAVLRR